MDDCVTRLVLLVRQMCGPLDPDLIGGEIRHG